MWKELWITFKLLHVFALSGSIENLIIF